MVATFFLGISLPDSMQFKFGPKYYHRGMVTEFPFQNKWET